MMDSSTIGDRLKKAREKRGMSRRELSLKAGLSPAQVGHIERKVGARPQISTIVRLAETLGVDLDWLASGRGCSLEGES